MRNTEVFYRGPSAMNPTITIRGVVTYRSNNHQTGDIPQTSYLVDDVSPQEAINTGADAAVCGYCIRRRGVKVVGTSGCYVIPFRAPRSVWASTNGVEANLEAMLDTLRWLRKRTGRLTLRFGAYGDPSSVPAHIHQALLSVVDTPLSYTHAWRDASWLKASTMASVESLEEAAEAQAMGWRTFRAVRLMDPAPDKSKLEVWCPTALRPEVTCATCHQCNGADGLSKRSYCAPEHGQGLTKHGALERRAH